MGLEPTTSWLPVRCSTNWATGPNWVVLSQTQDWGIIIDSTIRLYDTGKQFSCNSWLATQIRLPPQTPAVSTDYVTRKGLPPWKDTGGTRTHDDLNANQEFYQLNYWPIKLSCFRSNSRLTTGASRFDLWSSSTIRLYDIGKRLQESKRIQN